MTTSNTPTLACVARVHSQACEYTDARMEQLSRHVNTLHAKMHADAEMRERHKLRLKLIDRLLFLVLGALVGKLLDYAVLPAMGVFFLGLAPDAARELFEFFRKL